MELALLLLLMLSTTSVAACDGLLLVEDQIANQQVQGLFVFGDSVLDAGTNSYFPSLLRANFKPYGTTIWGKATGRFTNGRTYADFFATYLGLAVVDPYLSRKGNWVVMAGVNYASAGSGLLRATNNANGVVPFPDQILQFNQTNLQIQKTLKSAESARALFSQSLFLVNIGGNDLVLYLFSKSVPQEEFIDGLVAILTESIASLYEAGARKLMLMGIGPIGCVPGVLVVAGVTDGQCIEAFNLVVQAYNAALEHLVDEVPQLFPGMRAIVGKPYGILHGFLYKQEQHGFTAGVTACCGSGLYNAEAQCGRPANLVTNPVTNVCDNVDGHVFWDYFHPTDKVYGAVAGEMWSGNTSVVAPVNLRALVSS